MTTFTTYYFVGHGQQIRPHKHQPVFKACDKELAERELARVKSVTNDEWLFLIDFETQFDRRPSQIPAHERETTLIE